MVQLCTQNARGFSTEYLIGIILAVAVCVFALLTGFCKTECLTSRF